MKTIIYTLFFLLISASLQLNSQTAMLSPVNSNEQRVAHVKAIESRYYEGKVYLHITVNGNTETQVLAIERSLDAKNYEVIGFITINGNNAQFDLAYYFTDESPVIANLYYRLSGNSLSNEQVYSEITDVTPIDNSTRSICNEQTSLITAVTK
ncbi:MAG: hypothetical protein ABR968_06530 [Bacteroidales bacterium]|jgi:hypothetical protein